MSFFSETCTDDAKTLLEETIYVFQELSDVYFSTFCNILKNDVFNEVVRKLQAFDKKFHEFRKVLLNEDVSTHFLFCNAHFPLGLFI